MPPKGAPKKKVKVEDNYPVSDLQDLAHKLRIHSVRMTQAANSGHPTTCASSAEIMSVLFFHSSGMHYDPANPSDFGSDKLVLSKDAAWHEVGYLTEEDIKGFRTYGGRLEGHPRTNLPFVSSTSGSLGQGLGVGCGMAYASKYFDKIDNHYFVLCGDGEIDEGSIWEATRFAGRYNLDNLTAIVDCNRFGQSNVLGHPIKEYNKMFSAFGWNTIMVDGHNIVQIIKAFEKARNTKGVPTVVLCTTFKGKYYKGKEGGESIEDNMHFHGKALGVENSQIVIENLEKAIVNKDVKIIPTKPSSNGIESHNGACPNLKLKTLTYKLGEVIATRNAYGTALVNLADSDTGNKLIGLDADLKNSTFSQTYQLAFPDKFVECFIAEQNMVSVAAGISARGRVPFCSTFACFFNRAADQIRVAGMSNSNIKFCGSHAGVSIGEDGPSQMALEEIALFRSLPKSIVFYPSDAVSAEKAVELAANYHGPAYIRTARMATPVIYSNDEVFEYGKCKLIKCPANSEILVISAGVPFSEAYKAVENLATQGIFVSLIDLFSIKPFDQAGVIEAANKSGKKIIVFEESYKAGSIYETVCGELALEDFKVYGVYIDDIPTCGKPMEMLNHFGLSASKIEEKLKCILGK